MTKDSPHWKLLSTFDRNHPGYGDLFRSLFKLMEEEESPNYERISNAMFDAAKLGNDMVLECIFRFNPNLFTKVNRDGQSLLHVAILYRQASIYQLIMSKSVYKNAMLQVVDNDGNNVLHLAGRLVAEERFRSMVLLMCSEERWFKGVEEIVPATFKRMENKDGKTPEKLFYKEHTQQSGKAIDDLNQVANTLLVVGTLIVTLGITGALTIRTNTIQGRLPMFDEKTWKQRLDYVSSLQQRLLTGNVFLVIALGVLCTFAFMSGDILATIVVLMDSMAMGGHDLTSELEKSTQTKVAAGGWVRMARGNRKLCWRRGGGRHGWKRVMHGGVRWGRGDTLACRGGWVVYGGNQHRLL
ncbi:hypothetical protein PIB30_063918 [Stylosanthes scabra]|uniref:PGG domain-containing protein n=1 Tax=Stylosanthes scabra TaxID=79078 RepID=A0ABU6VL50_9FABA|nr:hypothetical protein [Stylosanthes scabra]